MKLSYWVRRTHKWIGLIIGVQALLWMISGAYMTIVPLEIIHGDHLAHLASDPLNNSVGRFSFSELSTRYPGITSFRLKRILDKDVFEIHQGSSKVALVDAQSGILLSPLKEESIRKLALAAYHGEGDIRNVEWVTQAPQEVASRPVPMWAVHFAEQNDATLYFSPHSGELLARRHNLWRWFDFLWMFHIMDYESRSDVNNNLLRVASITGLTFALSGIWLLFYSFRRRAAK